METRSLGSVVVKVPSRCSEQLDDGGFGGGGGADESKRKPVVVRSLFLKVADVSEEKRQKTGEEKASSRAEGRARDGAFHVFNTVSGENGAEQKD